MNFTTTRYIEQKPNLPLSGRHILAQYSANSLVVYQAYNPSIGHFAAKHGYFGGEFSYTRMSWCKPNFLWMMYRSGWGTKAGQEVTLAIRLKREFFDRVLAQAVPSSYAPEIYATKAEWSADVVGADVRLQWDPDHSPTGGVLQRRAIQLGLRGAMLAEYGREAILEIEDVSDFVAAQRVHCIAPFEDLLMPLERVYRPDDETIATRLGLSQI